MYPQVYIGFFLCASIFSMQKNCLLCFNGYICNAHYVQYE